MKKFTYLVVLAVIFSVNFGYGAGRALEALCALGALEERARMREDLAVWKKMPALFGYVEDLELEEQKKIAQDLIVWKDMRLCADHSVKVNSDQLVKFQALMYADKHYGPYSRLNPVHYLNPVFAKRVENEVKAALKEVRGDFQQLEVSDDMKLEGEIASEQAIAITKIIDRMKRF